MQGRQIEQNDPNLTPQAPLPVSAIGDDPTGRVPIAPGLPAHPPLAQIAPAAAPSELSPGAIDACSSDATVAPKTRTHFCRTCGDPWDPSWTQCPRCAARQDQQVLARNADTVFKSDQRRVRSAVALYFSLLGVSVGSIIYLAATGKVDSGDTNVIIGAEIAMSIIALAWCIPFARELRPLLARIPRPQWFALALLIAAGTMLLAQGSVGLLHHFLGIPEIEYLDAMARDGYGFGSAVLIICLQPAIIEELAFRGVILTSLESVVGQREALWVSALMFAILHLSIPSLPHLLVLGILLAWLRQRTGSMYAGMLMHFAHNFLVLLVEHNRSLMPW